MIASYKRFWALCAAVALVQTAALAKIVYDRQSLLKTGREITMQVLPVDPRDLMRGDFVTLGYELSPLTMSDAKNGAPLDGIERSTFVYVTLQPAADYRWTVTKFSRTYPAGVSADDVVLRGLVQQRWNSDKAGDVHFMIKYGIESYFVPEGAGKPIEQSVRDKKTLAVVSVGPDGTAALKALIIDGERHEDPPLF